MLIRVSQRRVVVHAGLRVNGQAVVARGHLRNPVDRGILIREGKLRAVARLNLRAPVGITRIDGRKHAVGRNRLHVKRSNCVQIRAVVVERVDQRRGVVLVGAHEVELINHALGIRVKRRDLGVELRDRQRAVRKGDLQKVWVRLTTVRVLGKQTPRVKGLAALVVRAKETAAKAGHRHHVLSDLVAGNSNKQLEELIGLGFTNVLQVLDGQLIARRVSNQDRLLAGVLVHVRHQRGQVSGVRGKLDEIRRVVARVPLRDLEVVVTRVVEDLRRGVEEELASVVGVDAVGAAKRSLDCNRDTDGVFANSIDNRSHGESGDTSAIDLGVQRRTSISIHICALVEVVDDVLGAPRRHRRTTSELGRLKQRDKAAGHIHEVKLGVTRVHRRAVRRARRLCRISNLHKAGTSQESGESKEQAMTDLHVGERRKSKVGFTLSGRHRT
jgi:hypothetical protein